MILCLLANYYRKTRGRRIPFSWYPSENLGVSGWGSGVRGSERTATDLKAFRAEANSRMKSKTTGRRRKNGCAEKSSPCH